MNSYAPRAVLAGLALGALLLAAPGPAAAGPSTDDIHRALGIDSVAADYIVLVDTSSSMQGARYAGVKTGLLSFLAALAPEDQVSLVTFDARATAVWTGPAGRSPQRIVDRLPKEARGTNTDIGLALEQAIRLLGRDGAPTIATVVLLTDGIHDPKRGSPYPFDKGYAWDQLRRTAQRLTKDSLSGYAIPLAGATGAKLLSKVVPGTVVLNPTAIDRATQLLEQPKRKVQAVKARQRLGDDLTRGVVVTWPPEAGRLRAGRQELTVVLRSTTAHIPIEVRDLVVSSDRPDVTVRPPDTTVTLEPNQSASVTLAVEWDPGAPTWKPWDTTSVEGTFSLSGRASTPWADALAADGMTFEPRLSGGAGDIRGTAQHGRPLWWLSFLAGAVLLVLLGRTLVRGRLRPAMLGALVATAPATRERTTMPLSGRQGTISKATAGIGGSGRVRGVREGLLSRQARIEISYTHNGSPDHTETKRCSPGESVVVSGVEFLWQPTR
ncbi:vWA domain-containing protein [Phytohabitans rumicis]|uniref:VWFA domain-containing protein n=1 Tax=Phytohabitans rumicis TaxID=1076125 RepID=A0A6V8KRW5_9ACTN|nr:vWA domain-containing protein [Phytohabitans rumicis]GFJ86594.1 hypothetical protein Prum_002360 [Phytohabitans rumicis]